MSQIMDRAGFDIRHHIGLDKSGRTACPACIQDGKLKQKNLSVDRNTGAYRCWRGCTTTAIRAAIRHPKGHSTPAVTPRSPRLPTTISDQAVRQAQAQLTASIDAVNWLQARGFDEAMIDYYRLGLSDWQKTHPAIAIHIPIPQSDQFYRKLRIAPWLDHDLPKWSQAGVPNTIFYTHLPEQPVATWFCEGEWDAMRLGWLAHQQNQSIAVCCSTAGCGAIPPIDQLNQLPGEVIIWFDRNDTPTKQGTIPGDEGAKKLAIALADRGKIAQVPMPDDCQVNGWDVSNALDAGFTWADFEQAAAVAIAPEMTAPVDQLEHRLSEILEQAKSPFHQEFALIDLAKELGLPYREVASLAKSLKQSHDTQADQVNAAARLRSLLTTQPAPLNLSRYLEPRFAEILLKTARAMPTAPEFLFTTLLSVAASRIGTSAQIVIKPSANYKQPMVIWSAIVAQSGSMKTPAQRVIIEPLMSLEKAAYASYQADLEDYEMRKAAGESAPKPLRQRYLTKDSTVETLQRLHGENPRGLLYYRDELAGAIKVRNQYRRGYGADEEIELDQWNGAAVLVDRSDKSVCLPQSSICRTGAIQWEVLGELMGDHRDTNGAWSRWLFCAADAPTRYLNLDQQPETGISEALHWLYTKLEQHPPQDYFLSPAAGKLFETWQHQLVDAQQAETLPGLGFVYPKLEAYTARLALWLHIVNAVLRQQQPTQLIDDATMEQAIELAAYYLWQHRLIHTHNSPAAGLAATALKIQNYVERVGEVTASKLKSGVRALRSMATAQIRQLMQTLANAGYGRVQGEGTAMQYMAAPRPKPPPEIDTIDPELTVMSTAETAVPIPFEQPIDTIDAIDTQPPASAPTPSATYPRGAKVEVWRDGNWLPAKYLCSVINSVLSHITQKLDDGHLVEIQHNPFPPHRVANADLRRTSRSGPDRPQLA